MNKQIIALCGKRNSGKSKTIEQVYEILASKYKDASEESLLRYKHKRQVDVVDVNVIMTIDNGIKIGIEGKGDPKDKQKNYFRLEKSIKSFVETECTVIICATRTSGETFNLVDRQLGYTVIRKYQQYKDTVSDQEKSNHDMAQEIVGEVERFLQLN